MWWISFLIIIFLIMFIFLKDVNKDNDDLKDISLSQKFSIMAEEINEYAFDGLGEVKEHVNDKRSFHIYKDGAPQIIMFDYGTGNLTITWRYKYMGDNEIVHKKTFSNVRNVKDDEQRYGAELIINEMDMLIDKKMIEVWGYNPNKRYVPKSKLKTKKENTENDSADKILKKVSQYSDSELTPEEKETAKLLYNLLSALSENPWLAYEKQDEMDKSIIKIATEIFKEGMWRLNNKDLANQYFNNAGYVHINVMKFVADLEQNYSQLTFIRVSESRINDYVLKWILKYRDDAKTIDDLL